jgi:nucleoid-associated protein YgaU
MAALHGARLRLAPAGVPRAIARWPGAGLAGGLHRLVGASALTVGLLPMSPAAALPVGHVEAPVIQPLDPAPPISAPTPPPAIEPIDEGDRPTPTPQAEAPVLRPAEEPRPGEHAERSGTPAARPPARAPTVRPAADPPPTSERLPGTGPDGSNDARHRPTPAAAADRPRVLPAHPSNPPAVQTVTVRPGDSFWSIAEELVHVRIGRPPTDPEVIGPWLDLIAANRDVLADPDDPDLLLPGAVLRLPARAGW